MAHNTHTPTEAANTLGLTSQSIRRYCNRFERYLSDSASPPRGSARTITERDLAVLRQIKTWTDAGHTYDQIDGMLDSLSEEEILASGDIVPAVAEPGDLATTLHQLLARDEQIQRLEDTQRDHGDQIRELQDSQGKRHHTAELAVRLVPWLTFAVVLLLLAVLLSVLLR